MKHLIIVVVALFGFGFLFTVWAKSEETPARRKPIGTSASESYIYVTCSDGTIWWRGTNGVDSWTQLAFNK